MITQNPKIVPYVVWWIGSGYYTIYEQSRVITLGCDAPTYTTVEDLLYENFEMHLIYLSSIEEAQQYGMVVDMLWEEKERCMLDTANSALFTIQDHYKKLPKMRQTLGIKGGIYIVDFGDIKEKKKREEAQQEFINALPDDPRFSYIPNGKVVVIDIARPPKLEFVGGGNNGNTDVYP